MNTPMILRYKEDLTGLDPNNLVQHEHHVVSNTKYNRIIAVNETLFYAKSLRVVTSGGEELRRWIDFKPVHLFPEATAKAGEAITAFFEVVNESVSGDVYIDYQCIGGSWSKNSKALMDLMWAVVNDNRPVFWEDILNKPEKFPPAYHTHDINRVYGWDLRIALSEQLIDMLTNGVTVRAAHVKNMFSGLSSYAVMRRDSARDRLQTHRTQVWAHAETKSTVGFDMLDNLRTATLRDARAGQRDDVRLTVEGGRAILADSLSDYEKNLMHQGILPVSRYGNLTYLQPGVAGSFEGSSMVDNQDAKMMIEEVDGTIVRLRPGTNGTTLGIYYDYILNGFNNAATGTFTRTNRQYWPAAMGGEYKPFQLYRSSPEVLWGRSYRIADFPNITTRYFVALTGNSFDHTKHDVAFFNPVYHHSEYGNITLTSRAYMAIFDDYVYCFDYCPWGNNRKVALTVMRCPVADIRDRQEVNFELLTGWTSTGGPYGDMTGDCVYLAPVVSSRNDSDQPMLRLGPDVDGTLYHTAWGFFVASDAPGQIKVAFGGTMLFNTNQALMTMGIGFRVALNVGARTADWVDRPQPMYAHTVNGDIAHITIDYNAAFSISQDKLAFNFRLRGNEHGAYYLNPRTGYYVKSYVDNVTNYSGMYDFGRIENWKSPVDSWDIVNRQIKVIGQQADEPTFGSPIGNNLMIPTGMNGNKMLLRSMLDSFTETTSWASYGTDKNYTYQLVGVGPSLGYSPQSDRRRVDLDQAYRFISYLDQNDVVHNWGTILTPWGDNVPVHLKEDVVSGWDWSEQINWDRAEMRTATDAFIAALDIASQVIRSQSDLVVPPDPELPVFAVIAVRYRTSAGASFRQYATLVDYTGARTGKISGFHYQTSGYVQVDVGNPNQVNDITSYREHQPGLIMSRDGDNLLCVLGSSTIARTPGGVANTAHLFSYNLRTKTIKPHPKVPYYSPEPWHGSVGYFPLVLPKEGMLMLNASVSGRSYRAVMPVSNMGRTLADWENWQLDAPTFVLMAQEVEKGWNIYFTEAVPVILGGREGVVPITSINLTQIVADPGNKTFYVYVNENKGVMTYEITLTEAHPTVSKMLIGTIKTSGSQIIGIDVSKRSRVGIYQISDSPTGSSIPVSTGLPTDVGVWCYD